MPRGVALSVFLNRVCCLFEQYEMEQFHAIMVLYNTVRFLEFLLDLGGVNVSVRALCKLSMQTFWDFQHIHVSYKNMQPVSSQLQAKRVGLL